MPDFHKLIRMLGNKITDLANPTSDQDAATKNYTDTRSWKRSVRAVTTNSGTLATSFENGDTIDGVTLVTGDRILIRNQVSQAENGIYIVNASGAPTRATDADTEDKLLGAAVFCREGTINAGTNWVLFTTAPITVDSTDLDFLHLPIPKHFHTDALNDGGPTLIPRKLSGYTIDEDTLTSGTVNDWDPAGTGELINGAVVIKITDASGPLTITGMVAMSGVEGFACLSNFSGETISLTHEDSGSLANNRWRTPTGETYTLKNNQSVWLQCARNAMSTRWVFIDSETHQHDHSSDVEGGSIELSWKKPVRAATTISGTLSTAFENGDTIDGVTLVTGDRILIKNQITDTQNGIYVVNASGAPTRATDADTADKLIGAVVKVREGSTQRGIIYQVTNTTITLGSTGISINSYPIAGSGLSIGQDGLLNVQTGLGINIGGTGNQVILDSHTHVADGPDGGRAITPGVLAPTVITESSLTNGSVNSWNPGGSFNTNGGAMIYIESLTGDLTINGIVAAPGNAPMWVLVHNGSTNWTITLAHESGSAGSAGQRIRPPNATSYIIPPLHTWWMSYQFVPGLFGFRWIIHEVITNHNHSTVGTGNQLVNSGIAGNAEIAVSKLADGDVLALLRTASNGTEVEWGASGQIVFPATQNPSSDPNTLDDYERGTFTITILGTGTAGSFTYAIRLGTYCKIGDWVNHEITINITATAVAGTGSIFLTGWPFTWTNTGIAAPLGYWTSYTMPGASSAYTYMGFVTSSGGATCFISARDGSGVSGALMNGWAAAFGLACTPGFLVS